MDTEATHIPVLFDEVLEYLQPKPDGRYIDGTLGAGGHTAGILIASAPSGRVLAFDRDPEAINFAHDQLKEYDPRVTFVNQSYGLMGSIAPDIGFGQVDGILLDLGLSSRQLEDPQRGFSFSKDGPLDMRYDPQTAVTAADLINTLSEQELSEIFWRYGEVRSSRRLAKLMIANRPLESTSQLAKLIKDNERARGGKHPATQVFQALRIAVNQELVEMEKGVITAIELLKPGGRFAVISFHSLEDRFVKQTFRNLARDCVCPPNQPICTCDARAVLRLVTRKAVKASDKEIAANPRSRSARLRVAEKLAPNNKIEQVEKLKQK